MLNKSCTLNIQFYFVFSTGIVTDQGGHPLSSVGAASQPHEAYQQDIDSDPSSSLPYNGSKGTRSMAAKSIQDLPTTMSPAFSQKVAFLPIGNSGTEFFPVRMDHLVANLPLVAAKLAVSASETLSVSHSQVISPEPECYTAKKILTPTSIKKTKFLVSGTSVSPKLTVTSIKVPADKTFTPSLVQSSVDYVDYNQMDAATSSHNIVTTKSQPAASPVYKSKLEKAMAQSQLMQNAAKENSQLNSVKQNSSMGDTKKSASAAGVNLFSKQSNTSLTSGSEIPVPKVSVPSSTGVSLMIASDMISRHNNIPVSPDASVQRKDISIPKTRQEEEALAVTKVAERYKEMVRRLSGSRQYNTDMSNDQSDSSPFPPQDGIYTETSRAQGLKLAYPEISHPETSYSYTYFTGHTAFSQQAEMKKHSATVTEKVYSDTSITQGILKYLWQLREDDMYCDAVIFTSTESVKVSKYFTVT